jgi:glycosyltransferase involved in cell wall biosynthesis
MPATTMTRLVLLSLEPWDDVWRRNQHLLSALVRCGVVEQAVYVNPPIHRGRPSWQQPLPCVRVFQPVQHIPSRGGGLSVLGWLLRRDLVAGADVLWVNNADLGRYCLVPGVPALYDVTDDWRTADMPARGRRRLVAAEDWLATRATTVVCSAELQHRWRQRYGVEATVVLNAVDVGAYAHASPLALPGPGPHVGYVGTLHEWRIDVDLVADVAKTGPGTVHLVGPDLLESRHHKVLDAAGVLRHGAVQATDVPRWLTSFDVLLSPHRVTPFTRSLDAIKRWEYLAARRPIVATPTSGFEHLVDPGVSIAEGRAFREAVRDVLASPVTPATHPADWKDRASDMAAVLDALVTSEGGCWHGK